MQRARRNERNSTSMLSKAHSTCKYGGKFSNHRKSSNSSFDQWRSIHSIFLLLFFRIINQSTNKQHVGMIRRGGMDLVWLSSLLILLPRLFVSGWTDGCDQYGIIWMDGRDAMAMDERLVSLWCGMCHMCWCTIQRGSKEYARVRAMQRRSSQKAFLVEMQWFANSWFGFFVAWVYKCRWVFGDE